MDLPAGGLACLLAQARVLLCVAAAANGACGCSGMASTPTLPAVPPCLASALLQPLHLTAVHNTLGRDRAGRARLGNATDEEPTRCAGAGGYACRSSHIVPAAVGDMHVLSHDGCSGWLCLPLLPAAAQTSRAPCSGATAPHAPATLWVSHPSVAAAPQCAGAACVSASRMRRAIETEMGSTFTTSPNKWPLAPAHSCNAVGALQLELVTA